MWKNLIAVAVIIALVAGVGAVQRARKAESLAKDLAGADEYQAYKALKKLAALGPGAMDKVAPLLDSGEAPVRARAAAVIAETGAPGYGPALVKMLQDSHPGVRVAAAGALGASGYRGGVMPLTTLLSDAHQPMEVRIAAARGLARLAAPEALQALIAVLDLPDKKDSAQLRQTAAVALGSLSEREAFVALTKHLDPSFEKDVQVRALAAQGLAFAAKAGTEPTEMAGEALVLAATKDKASEVRIAAVHSLSGMRFSGSLNAKVAEALQAAQDDPHYWVREAVSETR